MHDLTYSSSCVACRQSKIKCSGSDPCQNCQRRAVRCTFAECSSKVMVSEKCVGCVFAPLLVFPLLTDPWALKIPPGLAKTGTGPTAVIADEERGVTDADRKSTPLTSPDRLDHEPTLAVPGGYVKQWCTWTLTQTFPRCRVWTQGEQPCHPQHGDGPRLSRFADRASPSAT